MVGVRTDFTNQWSGGGLGELDDFFLVKLLGVGIFALIERLVENNCWLLDTLCLCDSGIIDGTENVVITERVGDGSKSLVGCLVVSCKVCNKNDVIRSLKVLKGTIIKN